MSNGRGIKKFNSFNSVVDNNAMAKNVAKNRSKVEKPVLLFEEIELINENLIFAINHHYEVVLCYYNSGFIQEETGNITVNKYDQTIEINHIIIDFKNIIKLTVID